MEPLQMNEVITLIDLLNLRMSMDQDNISPYFFLVASNILAPALCYFIDNAFRLGIFPKSCKIAKVNSLFKSENSNNLTTYRPILILTAFCKIFEKLIHQHLTNFFEKTFF